MPFFDRSLAVLLVALFEIKDVIYVFARRLNNCFLLIKVIFEYIPLRGLT